MTLLLVSAAAAQVTLDMSKLTPDGNGGIGGVGDDGVSGDRQNSYAWCMERITHPDGDYLYVGSNRNVIYWVIAASYISGGETDLDVINQQIDDVFNGDIYTPDPDTYDGRPRIFRYKLDGSRGWELVYRSPMVPNENPNLDVEEVSFDGGYRGMHSFTDAGGETALYVVTSGGTSNVCRVLKISEDFQLGEDPVEVFRAGGSTLRPITAHNGKLYIGRTADIWESDDPAAITPSAEEDETWTEGWSRVASGTWDFWRPAGIGGAKRIYASLWQLASFNGWIYATLSEGSLNGMIEEEVGGFYLFKGKYVGTGVSGANAYGWLWIPIVANQDLFPQAPYPKGLGTIHNNGACLTGYGDYLYVGTLMAVHTYAAAGELEYFLENRIPPQVYRFQKDTDTCDMIIGDPNALFPSRLGNYGAGFFNPLFDFTPFNDENYSLNHYVWWMAVYDGKLYCTTFDMRTFLGFAEDLLGSEPVINQYLALLELVNDNPAGFDLYVTGDGVNFEPVTRDGFGDAYNYGGRVLLPTKETLFLGTANPFYGFQIWALRETLPVADAGPNQTVGEGVEVVLNGSNSFDRDGSIVSYQWTQTGGAPVDLSDPSAAEPVFMPPDVGMGGGAFMFQLMVTDNDGQQSAPDSCIVNVTWLNAPPVASAGTDQTIRHAGETVTLDGSNSFDEDNGIASYQWTQTGEPQVALSDSGAIRPTFEMPEIAGGASLTFQIEVTDNGGLKDTDESLVTMYKQKPYVSNRSPVADAGSDQSVFENVTVTLDGTGSYDSDGLIETYEWTLTDGSPVTLSDPTAAAPTFTAPEVEPGVTGISLTFQLTVTDNDDASGSDLCIVNVQDSADTNTPPVVDAGSDQTVDEGETVTLDGLGSSDSDGEIVACEWRQTSGLSVTLSDPAALETTFLAPLVEEAMEMVFELTVTDDGGLKDTGEVTVSVNDVNDNETVTIVTSTGKNLGVEVNDGGSLVELNILDPESVIDQKNRPGDLMYGLIEMHIGADTIGGSVKIVLHLSEPAPEGYRWFKFNESDGWLDFSRDRISGGTGDGAEFNADRTQVTLYLTDGGPGDADGAANGTIEDPSGLGISGGCANDDGGSCFIDTLSAVLRD